MSTKHSLSTHSLLNNSFSLCILSIANIHLHKSQKRFSTLISSSQGWKFTGNQSTPNFVELDPPVPVHIPTLKYNLDKVLFEPGPHFLRCPSTGVFQFDPALQSIKHTHEFDHSKLVPYVKASNDNTLLTLTKHHDQKYFGSTSSMTGILGILHFFLRSPWNIDLKSFSNDFCFMVRFERANGIDKRIYKATAWPYGRGLDLLSRWTVWAGSCLV